MTKNQKIAKKKSAPSPNDRPTIGFLNASGLQFFHRMWCGVADVAREHNINAICFAGQYVRDPKGFKAQANILYDLIDAERLDGLVIQDLMCTMLDPDEARQFYERYRPLPIVSIGRRSMEGIPCVQSGGYAGMRQAIVHLVEVHGRHRIAYIKGLPTYRPIEERYRAYVDVLAEYGLPFDPARVAVPHDAAEAEQPDWGQVALCRLLDEQEADIDALVTNDDRFAHQLLPELQARGIRVPDDMALVGFGDEEGSSCITPPLTTVPIPMYEMGRQAAETLVAKLEGQKVLEQVVDVPSDRLIVRQSCGCLDPRVTQAVAGPVARTGVTEPLEVSLVGQREKIVAEMIRAAENSVAGLTPNWAEQLLDGFVAALATTVAGEAPARFLSTLNEILRQVLAAEGDIEVWPQVLSTMRRQLLPYLSLDEAGTLYRAEDLWLQAQAMIGEVGQRVQAYRNLQAAQQKRVLSEIGTALTTHFDLNDMADILARELPGLGISRGYLSLYEHPQPYRYPQPAPQWSRLVLAYDEGNPAGSPRVELAAGGRRFPSRQLVPEGMLPQQGPYTLMVQALYFQNEQIGFILLDGGRREGDVYVTLRAQISSALKGALLVQRVQENAAEIARQKNILDTFMDNVPDSIHFKDLDSRITQINYAFADHFGSSNPAEFVGKTDFDLFPDETARVKYEQEQEIIRTGHPLLDMEEPGGTPGHWTLTSKMPMRNEHGQIIGTFGISRDITPLKQAQHVLAQQARQLQTVAEVATAASTILDTDELLQKVVDLTRTRFDLYHAHIYLLNETEEVLVLKAGAGEKGHQMVAQGWSLPLAAEQSLVVRAARNRQGEIVNNVQANPHWLSNPLLPDTRSELAVPLIVGDQLLGVLDVQADEVDYFTEEDVHIQSTLAAQIAVAIKNAQLYHEEAERVQELAKLNVDLEAAQTELLRQERLATLGQLTAIVSHEIRNPLATIRASAFSVDRKTRNKDLGVEPALDRIGRNITRCDNIVAELLDYTRIQDSKLQTLHFDEWLHQVLDEQILPEDINVTVDLAANVEVPLDPERFWRVIINLIDNACQAMLEFKETSDDNPPLVLSIQSQRVNRQLKISISDTGPGIPPDVMPHIFEPLYSTKNFGVGLGLSVVQGIVEQHGGKIEINSEVGKGTQVLIWLSLD